MEAHNEARVPSPEEIARNLTQFSDDPAHPSLAWLYDEEFWHLLPSHMSASILAAAKK
jgi:hypothetical protein